MSDMRNTFERNFVSSAMESLAVEFGVDGALEQIKENGFLPTLEQGANQVVQDTKDKVTGFVDKTKEVGGFIKEDFNNLKESVSDLFASKEEKEAKKAEEEAKKAEEEAMKAAAEEEAKALQEEMERMRAELDKSYILHTAIVTCSMAFTNEAMNPSYIVLPKSHGVSVHGMPQLTVKDYVSDVNVLNFGICRSPHNPAVQKAARDIINEVEEESKSWTDKLMQVFVDDSKEDVCTTDEGLAQYCAAGCTPVFDTEWLEGKEDVLIDGAPALLGRCTLKCIHGGEIAIQSSGQMEE